MLECGKIRGAQKISMAKAEAEVSAVERKVNKFSFQIFFLDFIAF